MATIDPMNEPFDDLDGLLQKPFQSPPERTGLTRTVDGALQEEWSVTDYVNGLPKETRRWWQPQKPRGAP